MMEYLIPRNRFRTKWFRLFILHELADAELQDLISFIGGKLNNSQPPILEQDSWTVVRY